MNFNNIGIQIVWAKKLVLLTIEIIFNRRKMNHRNVRVLKLDFTPNTYAISQKILSKQEKMMDINWLDVLWLSASSLMVLFCF